MLLSLKWWSLKRPQWPQKGKNIRFTIFVLRKKPKDEADLQFYNDMICASVEAFFATLNRFSLLQLRHFFATSSCCTCTYWREREENIEERWRFSKKGDRKSGKLLSTQLLLKSENQRVDVKISKFVVGGILCQRVTVEYVVGKKIKWAMILLLISVLIFYYMKN